MKHTPFSFVRDVAYAHFESGADAYLMPTGEKAGAVVGVFTFPQGSVGLSERVVASLWEVLLPTGRKGASRAQVREAFEALGAQLSFSVSACHTSVVLRAHTYTFAPALALLGTLLSSAVFSEKEYQEGKRMLHTALEQMREDTRFLARSALLRAWFGEKHPHFPHTPKEALAELTRVGVADVRAFHEKTFSSATGLVLVLGGAFIPKEAERALSDFSALFSKEHRIAPFGFSLETRAFEAEDEEIFVADKMNVDTILGAPLTLTATDDDFLPLSFGVAILGDSSTARLFNVLRTKKNFTYGAYAHIEEAGEGLAGVFLASAIFPNTVFEEARTYFKEECRRWAEQGVSVGEVVRRKEELLGKRVVRLASLEARVFVLARALTAGNTPDFLDAYTERVGTLSRAQVQHALRTHLDSTRFRTASAGSILGKSK